MAETENAAKRTRETPKGPVKPEPAPSEAEQDSEARARQLIGIIQAESAAATPPDEGNGEGHAAGLLEGLQRSGRNGEGSGHGAIQPADLRTLQRLAGNAAVSDLIAPPHPPVQRAAIGASSPQSMAVVDAPERKAQEKRAAEAISAWVASAPKSDEDKAKAVEEVAEEKAQPGAEGEVDEAQAGGDEVPAGAPQGPTAEAGAEAAQERVSAEGEEVAEVDEATAEAATDAETEQRVGPSTEEARSDREALEEADAERAESAAEPQPPTVQLTGPSLGEMLGPSALASAAAIGPLGLVGPIAGLVAGATAESVVSATPGTTPRMASQMRQQPAQGGSEATTATQVRQGGARGPQAGRSGRGSRTPGRGGRAPATGLRGPSATRTEPGGSPTATAHVSSATASMVPASPAQSTELAPAPTAARDDSPALSSAAPPPTLPAATPPSSTSPSATTQQMPQAMSGGEPRETRSPAQERQPGSVRSGQARELRPAGGHGLDTAAQTPTSRSVSQDPAQPSDPARPSPTAAAIQEEQEPSRPTPQPRAGVEDQATQAATARADAEAQPLERGFTEAGATPHAGGRAGGGSRPRGSAPRGGGGGGGRAPAPPAPKPVPLGDAALEAWRSASSEAISGTEAGELSEAKEGPTKVEEAGTEIDSSRRGEAPDFEADAKSEQPEMPQEPEKEQVLDTGPAEAAVQAVVTAGQARLTDQTFRPLGTPPPYEGLNPSDYVPRQSAAYKAMKDLEERLNDVNLTDEERVSLTKQLEEAKAAVQEIGETAQKGTAEPPPTVVDEGPASLEPPDPAMGDLMGDVIARELGRVGERAKEISDTALSSIKGENVPAVSAIGEEELGTVKTELTTELNGIAEAAGVTEEQLKAKIDEQKEAVKAEEKAVEGKLAAASATATKKVEKRAQEEAEDIAGAKAAVDKEIQQKQDAVQGPPDTEAINKKRDEFLGKVETVGAQALAGLKSSLGKRESALDSTGGKQKTAAKQAANNQAAAIRRHWEADEDPNKGMAEARPTVRWGTTRAAAVDTEVGQKKTAAKSESDRLTTAAQDTIKKSKNDVRDWAAAQEGRERSWWEKLWDSILDWGKQAVATSEAWEKQRNADSRDKMGEDFESLTKLKTELAKGNHAAAMKELGAMDAEQQKLAQTYLKGGISSIEFVARSTIGRIKSRRAPELAKKIEGRAIAELGYEDLTVFAQQQGNASFNAGTLANQIRGAVSGPGTDEDAVYAALGKVNTAVERAALDGAYQSLFGTSMEEDVKSDMSGRELDRALALKEGKSAEAAAAAMAYAMEGVGTDEDTIRAQLKGKTPEEIKAIKAAYEKQTGRTLDADLVDDMSGAELDNALALSSGDPDAAAAAELQMAMEGMGTDEKGLEKVYDNIREEEEARAKREGLTPAELQANIQERNAKLKATYNKMYAGETGGLDVALRDELDDADLGVMDALAEGDATKIDAAMANREHESWYADDDKLEQIVRNQHKQADLEVNLELTAEKARMRAEMESGDVAVEDYTKWSKDWDQRYKDRDAAIAARSKQNMQDLKGAYSQATNGTQTFDELITQETIGFSQYEIKELVAAGGKLSDERELYYATAGAGTDEDKIKEIFKGKTPKEIEELRKKYAKNFPGRDMDDDIMSDLSGRENLDVGHTMKYGDPETFARQLSEAKTPEERQQILANMKTVMNERKSFEETGLVGGIFAMGADPMNSAEQLELAIQRAEEYDQKLAALDAMTPEERAKALKDPELMAAQAKMQMNVDSTMEAQEQVRKQIDSYTDAAVQVGAAVAGIAITIVTAGAAGPALAAAYGAMAAAAATMALKAGLKGAAYGWEEFGADLAIGAVDAAVSAATAGAGKVIMQAMQKAIQKQMAKMMAKQALKTAGKEAMEGVSESVAKKWLQEAAEEAIEGALGGAPTAMFEAAIDDNTWKSGDPWGAIGDAGLMGGGMGAGVSIGAKAGMDSLGAGYGKLKGALDAEPKVDTGTPDAPSVDANGTKTDASTSSMDEPDLPEADIDLPPAADPSVAAKDAAEGKLPPGKTEGDVDLPPASADADAKARADTDVDPVAGKPIEPPGPKTEVDTPGPAPSPKPPGATPVEPDIDVKKPSPDDVGKTLSRDELTTRYGLPSKNVDKLEGICKQEGIILDIRPTNPHSAPLLDAGDALPKPMKLKPKTINDLDVMLGLAGPDDLGKVGRFPPRKGSLPDNIDELPPGLQKDLRDRLAQREEEYFDTFFDIGDMLAKGEIDITSDGIIINKKLAPGKGELPFAGDHDLFDIRNKDGTALTPERYKEVRGVLEGADAGVEHGSVVGWETDHFDSWNSESGQKKFKDMMADHSEGGKEPLVRLGDGEPKAVWHEPAAPPKDAGKAPTQADVDTAAGKQQGVGASVDDVPAGAGPGPAKSPGQTDNPMGGQLPAAKTDAPAPGEELVLDTPEGTAGQLDGAAKYDQAENDEFFRNWVNEDPDREVGLLFNERTGEYVVFQGTNERVWLGQDNPGWMADLLDDATGGGGDWRLALHSHPTDASGVTPTYARWPSGGGGDWRTIVDPAIRSGKRVEAQVQYRTDEGDVRMKFAYDPNADKPYRIERPGEPPREYGTIEEYHADFKAENGFDLRPIPDDFPGRRQSAPDVEDEPTQVRPRPDAAPDDSVELDVLDVDDTQEMPILDPDKTQEMEAFDPDKTQEFDPDKTGVWERPPRDGDTVEVDTAELDETQEMEVFHPDETRTYDPDKTQEFDPEKTGVWQRPPREGGELDVDRTDLDIDVTQEIPVVELGVGDEAGLVAQLPGDLAKDREKTIELFQKFVDEDPEFEAAIFMNDWTGEYIVVRGGPRHVDPWRDNPQWLDDVLDGRPNDGNWVGILHNHPTGAGGITADTDRWPSGASQDWGAVVYPALRENTRFQGEIQYRVADGAEVHDVKLAYGYDPQQTKPYYIRRPDEAPIYFETIEEYHRFYFAQTGHPVGDIPDDFPGKRDHSPWPGGDFGQRGGDVRDVDPSTTKRQEPKADQGTATSDTDETQEMPAFDPDRTGTWRRPPSLDQTQEMPAVTQDAGTWDTFEAEDTQPFMQLPEQRGTHEVPASLRETQEMSPLDPGQGGVWARPPDLLDTDELPAQSLVKANDPGPGHPQRGLLRRVLDRAEPTLDWWFHPETQQALRLGLIEPNQERDPQTSGVLSSRDDLGRYMDDPRKFFDFF